MNSDLSKYSSISPSSRFLNLSARVKLSTAMMPRSPRAESALIRLLPIKPAAPVTIRVMRMNGLRDRTHQITHPPDATDTLLERYPALFQRQHARALFSTPASSKLDH